MRANELEISADNAPRSTKEYVKEENTGGFRVWHQSSCAIRPASGKEVHLTKYTASFELSKERLSAANSFSREQCSQDASTDKQRRAVLSSRAAIEEEEEEEELSLIHI